MPRAQLGLLIALIALSSCKPGGIQSGALVKMEYTLSVEGKVIDSSSAGGPFEFRAGAGQVVNGLERALIGSRAGQEKTVTVAPEDGYGVVDPRLVQRIPISSFGPIANDLKLGRSVQGLSGGKPATGRVIALDKDAATLDFNHPLAGKTLVFKVKILSVQS